MNDPLPDDADISSRVTERDQFTRLLKSARAKAVTARTILDLATVSPEEAIGPLFTGWKQIERVVALIASGNPRFYSLTLSQALEPQGLLRKAQGITAGEFATLASAHARYADGLPLAKGLCDWRKLTRGLEVAVLSLGDYAVRNVATRKRRIAHLSALIALSICSLAIIAAIVFGLVCTLVQPNPDDGLSATYFVKPDFSGHFFKRVDPVIDFKWKNKRPIEGMPADRFSVRWEGCVVVDSGKPMFFVAGADDGMEVFIDGKMVTDHMDNHPYREKWTTAAVPPGIHPIRIDYVEISGSARAFLGWARHRRAPTDAVPYDRLVPIGGNARHKCDYVDVFSPGLKNAQLPNVPPMPTPLPAQPPKSATAPQVNPDAGQR